jgi:hypothetical protein
MKSVKSVLLATTLVLTVSAPAMAQGISVGGQSRGSAAGQLGTGGTLTGSGQAGSNVTAPGGTVGAGVGASTDNSISSGDGAIGAGGAAHGNVSTSGRR